VVFGAAAVGVWRFSYSRVSLQQAFNHDLPDVRRLYEDLGFNFQHSKIIGLVQHALRLNSRTLGYLAIALAAYAVIEVCEGVGLWLLKRWGEYFAMVATSIFLPYEVYDLSSKVTALRVATFLVNLALVLYLVFSKRLLGVRGGKAAHEERLREGSILDQVQGEDAAVEADVPAASAGDLPDKPSSDFAERGVAQTVTDADPGSHENRPGAGAVASPQTRPGVRPQAGTAARTGTEADAASGDRPGDPANPGVTTSPGSPASPVATADAGDAGQPGR
jgi:uncharacterized membrane protein (DUF2068 family)